MLSTKPYYYCSHLDGLKDQIRDATNALDAAAYVEGTLDERICQLDELEKGLKNLFEEVKTATIDIQFQLGLRYEIAKKYNALNVSLFTDGVAIVKTALGSFYVKENGERMHAENFQHCYPFVNGMGRVQVENEKGEGFAYVNKSGHVIYYEDPNGDQGRLFTSAQDFACERAMVVIDDSKFFINESGARVVYVEDRPLLDTSKLDEDAPDIISQVQKLVKNTVSKVLNYSDMENYIENVALVSNNFQEWFIDKNGKPLWGDRSFEDAHDFSEGFALVKEQNEWKYIRKDGTTLETKFLITNGENFKNGLAKITYVENGKVYQHFLTREGKLLTREKYSEITDFSDGYAIARKENGRRIILSEKGVQEGELLRDYIDVSSFIKGCAWGAYVGGFELINYKGEVITRLEDSDSYEFYPKFYSNGYSLIHRREVSPTNPTVKNEYAIMCPNGKLLLNDWYPYINPLLHSEEFVVHYGVPYAVNNAMNQSGFYLSQDGEKLFDEDFDRPGVFDQGVAQVTLDGEEFYLDRNGRRIFG